MTNIKFLLQVDPDSPVRPSKAGDHDQTGGVDVRPTVQGLPFPTEIQSLSRELRIQRNELHRIRLSPAHGYEWPLWDADNGFTADPNDYFISDVLRNELHMWTQTWQKAADEVLASDNVYGTIPIREQWFIKGWELAARTAAEVWGYGDIIPTFLKYLKR